MFPQEGGDLAEACVAWAGIVGVGVDHGQLSGLERWWCLGGDGRGGEGKAG